MKTPIFVFLFVFVNFSVLKAEGIEEQIQTFQEKINNTNDSDTILYYLALQADLLQESKDYGRLGDIESDMGNHSNYNGFLAEEHYLKAKDYYLLDSDSVKYLNCLYQISRSKDAQGDYHGSILCVDSVIVMATHLGLSDLLIDAYTGKSISYTNLSHYNRALEVLNKAKKLALVKDDGKESLIKIYRSESHILLSQKEYERAIVLINEVIDFYKEKDSIRHIVMWSNNLAKVYDACRCGVFEDREKLINGSIRYAEESSFFYGKAYAYVHMARLYMEFDQLDKAYGYLKMVDKLLPDVTQKYFETWVYEVYGRFWEKKKNYKKSIYYEKKVLALWVELDNAHGQGLSSEKLSRLYVKLDDYKTAYKYKEQSKFFEDSLNSQEKIERYKELEVTAAFEKKMYADSLETVKEKQLATLEFKQQISEEKQAKTLLYFILAAIALGGLGIYIAYRKKKEQTELLDVKNKQIAEALEEKQLLLKEIHHRVKNNFQVVSSLLELQSQGIEDEKALSLAREGQNRVKAMALIHEKLYRNESGTIDFDEFIKLLVKELTGLYEDLEKVNVEVNSSGMQFDLDTAIPLGLIVNELITNSFKYAFSKDKINELKVSIDKADDQHYRLVVSDNGPGVFLNTEIRKIKSLGLLLVYRLTRQLKGKIELTNEGGARFDLLFKHIDARHSVD